VVVVARDRQHAERRAQAGELREELRVGVGARGLVDQVAAQEDEVGRLAERGVDPRPHRRRADELPVVEVGQPGDAQRRRRPGSSARSRTTSKGYVPETWAADDPRAAAAATAAVR
jgi:hypothetical protein